MCAVEPGHAHAGDDCAMSITIRRAEPGDFEAARQIYNSPRVIWGTLQIPYPSAENWRKRLEPDEAIVNLLAGAAGEGRRQRLDAGSSGSGRPLVEPGTPGA